MIKLLLVRHGHVEGIKPERFRGRRDLPLSQQGLQEAAAVARYIAGGWQPAAIYTSPLQRCVHTGRRIAEACGLQSQICAGLNDLDYGTWQWQTHAQVEARWPQQFELWRKAPERVRFAQGESLQDLNARTADALRAVLQQHADGTVVMVGHDSCNRVLLLQCLELPLSAYWRLAQDPCGVSEIELTCHGAKVLRINDTQHLNVKSS